MRRSLIGFTAVALLAAGPRLSSGQEPDARPADVPPPAPADAGAPPGSARPAELSAADVAGAPRPDQARGLVQDDRGAARHLLWVPRVILFVPKWALWVAASPVRGGLYVFERYGLGPRLRRLLSGDGPFSVFPSVARESGHGLTYGIGAAIRPHVRANFLFGGEVQQVYDLRLKTDDLLGDDLELELRGQIQLLEESQFFGIGNGDLEEAGMNTGIDAQADPTAVQTRFDQQIVRTDLTLDWRPLPRLTTLVNAALLDKEFSGLDSGSDGDLVDIAAVYDTGTLVGFDTGSRFLYGELRLGYDDRVVTNPFVSLAQPSSGWKLEGFAGYAEGLSGDPSRYLRYGLDLQRYFDLYLGDRILVLRAHLEGVTAGVDEIPFTELPRLGGSRLMRGYGRNRFRDRTVAAFSVEYKYPISRYLGAFTFIDGGGAWRKLSSFDAGELHPGVGGGIQLHTADLFLTRVLVGGGDDGVTLYLSFSPSSQLQLTSHQW